MEEAILFGTLKYIDAYIFSLHHTPINYADGQWQVPAKTHLSPVGDDLSPCIHSTVFPILLR